MNKCLSLSAILVFAFLFHYESSGQKNFKPATVVLQNGDTLTGEIDYQNWKNNPVKITFRKAETDLPVAYGPTEVSFFSVMNDIYIGDSVSIDQRSDQLNELNENAKIKLHRVSIFLSLIIAGNKPLYYYNNGTDHFYIRKDGKYELLLYKLYLAQVGPSSVLEANKEYISQLSAYLDGCSGFSRKLVKTAYTLRSMRQLFLDYYNCVQAPVGFVSERQRSRSEYGLLAGVTSTRLKVLPTLDYFPGLSGLTSVDMTGGIFLDIVLPRNLSRISINTELVYSSYSFEGNTEKRTSAEFYTTSAMKLSLGYLKINNMGRYKFPIKKGALFFNAGISNGLAVSETNSMVVFVKNYSREETRHEKVFSSVRKHEQGYLLGVGGRIQRFSFEVRMEKGNGTSTSDALKTTATRFFAMLGFRIH